MRTHRVHLATYPDSHGRAEILKCGIFMGHPRLATTDKTKLTCKRCKGTNAPMGRKAAKVTKSTMSRQFEHLQEATLRRLQALIPHDCPLVVHRLAPGTTIGGFVVTALDSETTGHSGRFQVVAAWIDGYVTAWKKR